MTNFGAKILNNAVGALAAQQAVIATASNNIANVHTPGYARRTIDLQTRVSRNSGSLVDVGNGVEIGKLVRATDQYLEAAARGAGSDKGLYSVQKDFLSRLNQLFDLTGDNPTVGTNLSSFFAAVDDLAADPASIPLRTNFIQKANDLVTSIKTTYDTIANLQAEADQRLGTEIETINSFTGQIATLNGAITSAERAGRVAADERDQRDQLLQKLAEKVSFSSIEGADGALTISLTNGFALVSGTTHRDLETTTSPTFASGPVPPSLKGAALSYIVYDYDSTAGASHIDLTQALKNGGGTVAGLLALRGYNDPTNTSAFDADGTLVQVASRVEALARELLTTVNQTYLGADRDSGTAVHDPSSGDLNGNTPSVYGLFDFTFVGTKDADGNGLPDDLSALGIDNFASRLSVAFSDPRRVAAALDSGAGAPAAAVFAPGDGRNMLAISALQDSNHTFGVGSYSFSGTFDEEWSETVGYVGVQSNAVEVQSSVAEDKYTSALNSRDEVAGVSLDEEFTTLIKFQKTYQAAAKLIKVADQLLDQIVSII
ncbi:MAG: flagellar hook-associated protein FlgK [Oligoflexia bacterium]|nr:flagellar hook-associated protein FlgK [Oligoflexia bacterium]